MDKKMNDPKERITQARESWEVRREDSARAKITSEGSQANDKTPAEKENNIARGKGKKRKLYLKKSVRRTVGSLLLATSVIVAAVPVGDASAVTEKYNGGVYEEAPYISETEIPLPSVDTILGDASAAGHVKDGTTGYKGNIVPGADGRYGYPLKLIWNEGAGQYEPERITINGHTYSYVDSSVYLSGGAIDPLFLMDNSNLQIKKCLQPVNYIASELSLDCYYGYNEDNDPGDHDEIFYKDGVAYKYHVTKESASNGNRYVAQLYRWQENSALMMMSRPRTLMTPLEEEQGETPENGESTSTTESTGTPTPTPTPTEETPTPTPEVTETLTTTPVPETTETPTPSTPSEQGESFEPTPIVESVESEPAGAGGFSLAGKAMIATVDDLATGKWIEEGSPVTLCWSDSTYNKICNDAFKDIPQSIRTVNVPDYSNLQAVGEKAFMGTALTSINLVGNQLNSLGVKSFANCQGLTSVNLGDAITMIGDGAFAEDGIGEIHIPHSANVGCAAFYGNSLKNVDVSECININVGDYAFANNKSLSIVDLDYKTQDKLTISNLSSISGLFAGCTAMSCVALPSEFDGTLKSGVFQNCTGITKFVVRNPKSDFTGGEFDRSKIIVYGPDPDNLNPDTSAWSIGDVNAYKTCLEWISGSPSYSYDYRYNGCSTPINYNGSDQEPSLNTIHKYCNNYIENGSPTKFYPKTVMQVDGSEFISGKFERAGGPEPYTLVIDGGVGVYPNQYNVSGINSEVFMNDNHLEGVRIGDRLDNTYSLSYLGEKTFYNCPNLTDIFVNVNGTTISKECFANNGAVNNIELGRAGTNPSTIGEKAFYNCGSSTYELPVSFINDDLRYGAEGDYAVIDAAGIGDNAFGHDSRTVSIVFKGPMDKTYGPFAYAIQPAKVGPGNYFIKYRSGNPRNLECIYKLNWSEGGTDYPEGVYLLSYPNMTSHLGSDEMYPGYGDEVSPRDIEDIYKGYNVDHDPAFPHNTTDIENSCVTYTKDITVPDGIDYIDIAESEILDVICPDADAAYLELHPMYYAPTDPKKNEYKTYSETSGNYDGTCPHSTVNPLNAVYKQFRYVKDLNKVSFDGQQTFPDKMFEGSTDLTEVNFNKDVIDLGELPFYLPDTEKDLVEGHVKPSPSTVKTVNFNAEEDYTVNPCYRGSNSGLVGMIKSDNNEGGNKKVYIEQIVPGRGYAIGEKTISSDELRDISAIKPYAARDCDSIDEVQLNGVDGSIVLEKGCFYDCDQLQNVFFPDKIAEVHEDSFAHILASHLNVYVPSIKTTFRDNAFRPTVAGSDTNPGAYILGPDDNDVIDKFTEYADKFRNVNFKIDESQIKPKVRFILTETTPQTVVYQGQVSYKESVEAIVEGNPDLKEHLWEGTDLVDLTPKSITALLTHDTDFFTVKSWLVTFTMPDGETEIGTARVTDGEYVSSSDVPTADEMPELYNGKRFSNKWLPSPTKTKITKDTIIKAVYDTDPTPTPTPTPTVTPTPTSTPSSSSSSSSGSSSSSSRSSSSSSRSSSSSSSSSAYPVYVNSQDTLTPAGAAAPGAGSTVYIDESTGGGSGDGSGSGGKKGSGNANVISTTGGISDTSKISATVNGSSDNYIVKITQTQEADEMGLQALHNEYGEDISPIRYLCFDISLYDSTGTNKISPVPEGVSVTLTMPIPDDLAIYGGNAKICCTSGGVMEKMQPRFTVIDGVPCMTYTCTHFSPYMVWVDTNNLTAAGIADATPKTADGIHPKWFLCFGLAAIAIVMFLKKDPEEYLKKKAA